MRRNLKALVLALVLLTGFVVGVAVAPERRPRRATALPIAAIFSHTNCVTCCYGQLCPDLNCP